MNKFHTMTMFFAVGVVSLVFAANSSINLTGTITDQDGKPLPGVTVFIDKNSPIDTTGADGKYALVGTGVSEVAQFRRVTQPIILSNAISFNINVAFSDVRLEILDLSGRCVKSVMNCPASVQAYTVPLPLKGLAPSTYIVSLRIGNESFIRRVLLQEDGMLQSGNTPAIPQPIGKQTATGGPTNELDIMHFVKANFTQVDKPIYSYEGIHDTSMKANDTIPPVVKLLPPGTDTVYYAFQDTVHYMKYWDTDSITKFVKYEDNSGSGTTFFPPTNTLMGNDHSNFCSIPYMVKDYAGNVTTVYRLLVLFDSTVKNDIYPPMLSVGSDTVKFTKGDKFSYKNGVTARDSVDSLIVLEPFINYSDNIKSVQKRNAKEIYMDIVGKYTMTYKVMDTHKNLATRIRILIVSE